MSLLAYVTNYPRLSTSVHCKIELTLVALGQEPWSSGYVRWLMYEGCGFESWHHILDHFFTYICCKNWNDVCLKRPKINNKRGRWGVIVAQLVERSRPISEVCGLNPVIGKYLFWTLFTVNCIEKTKIKKKRPGLAHFLKNSCRFRRHLLTKVERHLDSILETFVIAKTIDRKNSKLT